MLLVNKEHLEDEVLKSIQKKAESMANQSDDSPDSVFDEGLEQQKGQSFL